MPTYINKERTHDHAARVRSHAWDKAERYESLKPAFEDWAKQAGKTEEEIADGLQKLDDLVEYWSEQAEIGER